MATVAELGAAAVMVLQDCHLPTEALAQGPSDGLAHDQAQGGPKVPH